MRRWFQIICLTAFLFVEVNAFGQKVRLKSGDWAVLAGEKTLNVIYDYSDFGVGEFASEKEYVHTKVMEYNMKEAGKGDRWGKAWFDNRKNQFEPNFEGGFNKIYKDKGPMLIAGDTGAKYTLIVRTIFVEPGYNVAIAGKNASVDFGFDLVETANNSVNVAQIVLRKVPGVINNDFNFNTGIRIAESYFQAGVVLSRYIKRKI